MLNDWESDELHCLPERESEGLQLLCDRDLEELLPQLFKRDYKEPVLRLCEGESVGRLLQLCEGDSVVQLPWLCDRHSVGLLQPCERDSEGFPGLYAKVPEGLLWLGAQLFVPPLSATYLIRIVSY